MNYRLFLLLSLAVLTTLLSGSQLPAQAQISPTVDAQRVVELDRMGGLVGAAVPLPDGTLLMGEGASLVHLSTGRIPDVLARADLGYGSILDLAESSGHILALTESGLLSLPMPAGAIPAPVHIAPGGGQTLAVKDDLVTIAAREAGVRVVRVSPDGLLSPLALLPLTPARGETAPALDIVMAGDSPRAYVAAGEAGVYVVDLTTPEAPQVLGSFPAIAPADSVTIVGALLVVASEGRVVAVDPSTGEVIGVHAPLRDARRVAVQDEFAYVADAADGVKILYLAAPDRPVQIYGETGQPAYDVLIDGDLLYVAAAGGLRILDAGSRYRPLELGQIELPGTPQELALDADTGRVFIALGEEGVAVIDARNLASPQVLRVIKLAGSAYSVHFGDGVLYAAGEEGLAIITGEPGQEVLAATFALPGPAYDVDQRGRALFIASGTAGLLAVDVTYPAAPALMSVLPMEPISSGDEAPREARSVVIVGKRAFVGHGDGFIVADISRADHLARLTGVAGAGLDVAASGVYVFGVRGNEISVFDARATAEPIYLRSYIAPAGQVHLSASGDLVFAAPAGSGPDIAVLSFAAPDFPIETDNEGEQGHSVRAIPVGQHVWLAAGFAGLQRYEITEGGALIPRGGYTAVREAAVVTVSGSSLISAGQSGWVNLALGERGTLHPLGGSPDALSIIDVAQEGDRVAAAAGESGVALYDVTDASRPVLIAQQETYGPAAAVALDASFVFAADAGGLSIFERGYLYPVARVSTPSAATDVVVRGGRAYVSLLNGSLAVIELGDPRGGISQVRSIETRRPTDLIPTGDGRLYGLADNSVYWLRSDDLSRLDVLMDGTLPGRAEWGVFSGSQFGAFSSGDALRFYDLSALDVGVSWQGTIDLAAFQPGAEDIALNGQVVYIAYGEGGLGLIYPLAPATGLRFYQGTVHTVLLSGTTLFALGDELTAWDVTNAEQPRQLSSLALTAPGRSLELAPGGNLLVSLDNGLLIAAWDGTHLSLLGQLVDGSADRAVQIGSRAYIAMHRGGLLVADVADPAQPAPLFTYVSPSGRFVHDLLAWDERHLLVSWEGGIDVLDVSTMAPAPYLLSVLPTGRDHILGLALDEPGTRAATALGEDGIALIDLSDPTSPTVAGTVDTPGSGLAAALNDRALFVADGPCGLRVFDPISLQETGYWRGSYASTVAAAGDVLYVGGGSQVASLQYDPSLPAVLPPMPQQPDPASGAGSVPIDTVLTWEPPADACDPLVYDVYLGVSDSPPAAGQVADAPAGENPSLSVGQLHAARNYTWRVDVTDRQGDRSSGPVWQFATISGIFPDVLPPAPAVFVDQLRQHPAVPLGLIGAFLGATMVMVIYWRMRREQVPEELPLDAPEWFTTGDEEVIVSDGSIIEDEEE